MERRKWYTKDFWPVLVIIGFDVVCFCFFQLQYSYHFFFKGQNQLFLMSWSYVSTLFAKPAWAACLIGEFLTQFYYYDIAGATILTISLTVLFVLSYLAFKSLGLNRWMTVIAAMAIVMREASCHLYYGYMLSSTYALLGGLLLFLLLRGLMRCRWPLALVAVLFGTLLCYWLFGYGVWAYLLLSAFAVWKVSLPIAAAFLCLLPFMRNHYNLTFSGLCQYPHIESLHLPDFNKETEMHMIYSYETGDWDDVEKMAESDPVLDVLKERGASVTKLSIEDWISSTVRRFIYNLVEVQKGKLPDVLMTYYPNYLGTFTSMTRTNMSWMVYMNMHEFYYAIGDISRAERGAFMSCVSVPNNRNAYAIKRLAECALVRNDKKAAEKFLGLLRQTVPYNDWARSALNDKRYKLKAQYINQQDSILTSDNSYEILTQLLKSNPKNEVALDYLLCSLLQKKDLENFKLNYDLYCTERPRIRNLYQEALCIWLISENAAESEWSKYIKDKQIRSRIMNYMENRTDPAFEDTYWYYFDFFNLNGN